MRFIVMPIVFMSLAILAVLAYSIWCALCFRFGHWFAESVCAHRQSRRSRRDWQASPKLRLEAAPPVNPYPPPREPARPGRGSQGRHSSGIALILALLVACLVFFGFQSRHISGPTYWTRPVAERPISPTAAKEAPALPSDDRLPPWTVTRLGKTRDDAREVAINDACEKVKAYLHDELHLRWNPSPQYFRKYVATQMVKQEDYKGTREVADLGTVHEVTLRVEMSPENQKDLLRRDRLFLFAKLIGIAVALLATGAIYIRFDEASKGYYTAWLRLGAISTAAAFITGWWFVSF